MLFSLVDRVWPVDVEKCFGQGGNTVYVLIVEHNDADTEDVGNVGQRLIFVALELQFACQRWLGLDARFHGINFKASLHNTFLQQVGNNLL